MGLRPELGLTPSNALMGTESLFVGRFIELSVADACSWLHAEPCSWEQHFFEKLEGVENPERVSAEITFCF